jgi:hypothetical protein
MVKKVSNCTVSTVKFNKKYPIRPRVYNFLSEIHFKNYMKTLHIEVRRLTDAMHLDIFSLAHWRRPRHALSQEDVLLKRELSLRAKVYDHVEPFTKLESPVLIASNGLHFTDNHHDLFMEHHVYTHADYYISHYATYQQKKLKKTLEIDMVQRHPVESGRYEVAKRPGLRNPTRDYIREKEAMVYIGRLAIYRLRKEAIARTSGTARAVNAIARKITRGSFYVGLVDIIASFIGDYSFNYKMT